MKKFFLTIIFIFILFSLLLRFFPNQTKIVRSKAIDSTSGLAGFFTTSGSKLKKSVSFIFEIKNLKNRNNEITDQLLSLNVDKSRIQELETENALLKKELGFLGQDKTSSLIPAKIIDWDPTTLRSSFVIDKGELDGLKVGMPIISNGILVGQIKELYQKSAYIVLVTSKDSIVQVMLQDSRAKGLLRGGNSGLFVENIISDTDYKEGEYVITSGLGGKMRQGILVGRAGKADSLSSSLYKNIAVESLLDLSKLEIVFVEK